MHSKNYACKKVKMINNGMEVVVLFLEKDKLVVLALDT